MRSDLSEKISPLIEMLNVKFPGKIKFTQALGDNFYLNHQNFGMYLRYEDHRHVFTCASIEVRKQTRRQKLKYPFPLGWMIYRIMIDFARQNGFERFVSESVITPEGEALCKLSGLSPCKYTNSWQLVF